MARKARSKPSTPKDAAGTGTPDAEQQPIDPVTATEAEADTGAGTDATGEVPADTAGAAKKTPAGQDETAVTPEDEGAAIVEPPVQEPSAADASVEITPVENAPVEATPVEITPVEEIAHAPEPETAEAVERVEAEEGAAVAPANPWESEATGPSAEATDPTAPATEGPAAPVVVEPAPDSASAGTSGVAGAPPPAAPASPAVAPPPERGSVWPMLIAGIVTAAIGFGAAWAIWGRADTGGDRIAQLESQQGDLQKQLAGATQSAQTAAKGVDDLRGSLGQQLQDLQTAVGQLQSQMKDLQQRPTAADGNAAATAAYEKSLQAMQDSFSQKLAQIQAQAQKVAQAQNDADKAESLAAVQAALAQLRSDLDSGAAFGDVLDRIATAMPDLPVDPLRPYADGVPTQAALRQSFPDAARAANAADRGQGGGGVGGFLRGQLGLRSLTPREGTGTDAVLSRAQDRIDNGDLAGAVDELNGLSGPAAQAMADWTGRAKARLQALAAYQDLSSKVES